MYQFTEIQKFRQWWIWLILAIAVGTGIYAALYSINKGRPELIIGIVGPLLVTVLIFSIKLETRVDVSGVHYRFFPIHIKERTIPWDEIEMAGVRKYNAISEFGGWGMRYTFGKNGRALNISGNMGLQLIFKNGKKLLIGTQRAEDIGIVLRDLGK